MISSKAQGALEFTVISTFALLLFAASFIVVEKQFIEKQENLVDQKVAEVMDLVETEILLAKQAGEGYERLFVLPYTLDGVAYNISILGNESDSSSDELVIKVGDKEYFLFLTVDVEGDIGKGYNNITGGDVIVVSDVSENFNYGEGGSANNGINNLHFETTVFKSVIPFSHNGYEKYRVYVVVNHYVEGTYTKKSSLTLQWNLDGLSVDSGNFFCQTSGVTFNNTNGCDFDSFKTGKLIVSELLSDSVHGSSTPYLNITYSFWTDVYSVDDVIEIPDFNVDNSDNDNLYSYSHDFNLNNLVSTAFSYNFTSFYFNDATNSPYTFYMEPLSNSVSTQNKITSDDYIQGIRSLKLGDDTIVFDSIKRSEGSFSFGFWFKGGDKNNYLFELKNETSSIFYSKIIKPSGEFKLKISGIDDDLLYDLDSWHHIVVVYDSFYNEFIIYYDDNNPVYFDTVLSDDPISLYLGGSSSSNKNSNLFSGYVDTIVFWDKALSEQEVNYFFENSKNTVLN